MQVITGRPAHEIAPLLGLEPSLEVWGLHGAERLYTDGRRELEEAPAEAQAKLEALREFLRRENLGGLFEDKANGVVMHWRGETSQKAKLIEQRTRALFEPVAQMEGLMLLNFEFGLELRAGRDKGGAVKAILEDARSNGFVGPAAFLGDDLTDESAFAAVNELEGAHLSVLVRGELRTTVADVWLRPPEEVRGFLKSWVEAGVGRTGCLISRTAMNNPKFWTIVAGAAGLHLSPPCPEGDCAPYEAPLSAGIERIQFAHLPWRRMMLWHFF